MSQNASTLPRCGVCGRQLKDPESIARGVGPVCAGKSRSGSRGGGGTAGPGCHVEESTMLTMAPIEDRPLSPTERQGLRHYEAIIKHGLRTFVNVGNALICIRNGQLYREEYATFEEYCDEKWGFTGRRARYLMSAAKTVTYLEESGTIVPLPESDGRRKCVPWDTNCTRQRADCCSWCCWRFGYSCTHLACE